MVAYTGAARATHSDTQPLLSLAPRLPRALSASCAAAVVSSASLPSDLPCRVLTANVDTNANVALETRTWHF